MFTKRVNSYNRSRAVARMVLQFHSADKVTLTYGGTRIKIPHIPGKPS